MSVMSEAVARRVAADINDDKNRVILGLTYERAQVTNDQLYRALTRLKDATWTRANVVAMEAIADEIARRTGTKLF